VEQNVDYTHGTRGLRLDPPQGSIAADRRLPEIRA